MGPGRLEAQDARVWARIIIAAVLDDRDAAVLVRLASMAGADIDEVERLVAAAFELARTGIVQPSDRLVIRRR